MARYTSKTAVKSARAFLRSARWSISVCTALCLSLPTLAVADVHPYERWAEELGIDLNVSYDGIRVMEMQGGKFEATERRAPGKMYTEVNMGGVSSGVILREDLNKSYMLMPSMGYYKEDSLDGGMLQASNGMEFTKIEMAGKEDVIGYPSTKFKTRFKDNEGKGAGIIWITDSGVPIRMEMIYSNGDFKGERLTVQFVELHLRAQDPSVFELPPNLKPMNMGSLADIVKMSAMQGGTMASAPDTQAADTAAATVVQATADMSDEQQNCLKEAIAKAEEEKKKAEKKKGFGRLLGSLSRTASRLGITDLGEVVGDLSDANATAEDIEVIAEELGISEDDVKRCQEL